MALFGRLKAAALLFGVKTRAYDSWCPVDVDCLHIAPLLRRLSSPRFREHVIDPTRSLCLDHPQKLVVERLAVGILLPSRIGSLPLREGRVQQYISGLIVGE